MSRLFEALSKADAKRGSPNTIPPVAPRSPSQGLEPDRGASNVIPQGVRSPDDRPSVASAGHANRSEVAPEEISDAVSTKPIETSEKRSILVKALPESHLIALTDPNSLGAEKFRAFVTRLDHFRKQRELKSFQVTSSVVGEGKSLVAGNVAVTFAKYFGSKTLLIEGDLHRPTLSTLFGFRELPGVSQWWSCEASELMQFVYRLNDMPLWFLPAGKPCDRPSDILRSARFSNAYSQFANEFEWIVVDSTPMLPIVDVNLWSRLVDGTLLVVREGVAPVKALKKGLQALDHPKLIGVVLNEASGSDQANYEGQYYGFSKP